MSEQSTLYDDGKNKLDHLTEAQYALLKAQQLLSHAVQSAIIARDYPELESKPIKYEAILKALNLTFTELKKAQQMESDR